MREAECERSFKYENSNWWFVGMRDIYRMLSSVLFKGQKNKIIDIGCGTGIIMQDMRRYGGIYGMDISRTALLFCRERGEKIIFQGSATALPVKSSSFDGVVSFGVIEHIEEDRAMLREMARICKPSGVVFFYTSAYPFLWSYHDVANEHKRRYLAGDLKKKVEEAGLQVLKISYVNTFLFPMVLLIRTFQKLLLIDKARRESANPQRDIVNPPLGLNKLLRGILSLEGRLLKVMNLPFGVGIICIAKKGSPQK